jgi:hypothetical protein
LVISTDIVTAGREQVAERCSLRDPRHFFNKHVRFRSREAAQQDGAFFELLVGAR